MKKGYSKKNAYRGQMEIIGDILDVCLNGAKPTHIMYGANLSYHMFEFYQDFLIKTGLVKRIEFETKSGAKRFKLKTTVDGRKYLQCYEIMKILLKRH